MDFFKNTMGSFPPSTAPQNSQDEMSGESGGNSEYQTGLFKPNMARPIGGLSGCGLPKEQTSSAIPQDGPESYDEVQQVIKF